MRRSFRKAKGSSRTVGSREGAPDLPAQPLVRSGKHVHPVKARDVLLFNHKAALNNARLAVGESGRESLQNFCRRAWLAGGSCQPLDQADTGSKLCLIPGQQGRNLEGGCDEDTGADPQPQGSIPGAR